MFIKGIELLNSGGPLVEKESVGQNVWKQIYQVCAECLVMPNEEVKAIERHVKVIIARFESAHCLAKDPSQLEVGVL